MPIQHITHNHCKQPPKVEEKADVKPVEGPPPQVMVDYERMAKLEEVLNYQNEKLEELEEIHDALVSNYKRQISTLEEKLADMNVSGETPSDEAKHIKDLIDEKQQQIMQLMNNSNEDVNKANEVVKKKVTKKKKPNQSNKTKQRVPDVGKESVPRWR